MSRANNPKIFLVKHSNILMLFYIKTHKPAQLIWLMQDTSDAKPCQFWDLNTTFWAVFLFFWVISGTMHQLSPNVHVIYNHSHWKTLIYLVVYINFLQISPLMWFIVNVLLWLFILSLYVVRERFPLTPIYVLFILTKQQPIYIYINNWSPFAFKAADILGVAWASLPPWSFVRRESHVQPSHCIHRSFPPRVHHLTLGCHTTASEVQCRTQNHPEVNKKQPVDWILFRFSNYYLSYFFSWTVLTLVHGYEQSSLTMMCRFWCFPMDQTQRCSHTDQPKLSSKSQLVSHL